MTGAYQHVLKIKTRPARKFWRASFMVETEGNRTPRPERLNSWPTTGLVDCFISHEGPLSTGFSRTSPLILSAP
jgi:hypothetical protein